MAAGTVGKGTPGYMSPEVIKGENIDFRVDVYSFGIMLWEVMMLEKPFKRFGDNIFGIAFAVVNGERPEPIPSSPPSTFQIPLNTFEKWIGLMKRCWDGDFQKRPFFDEILKEMEEINNNLQ